jgi:hypothetical protein
MSFFPLSNVPAPVFSPLSHTQKKNGYIIGIPFLSSTRLSYKKYKNIRFVRVTSSTLHRDRTFSDLSPIHNNIGMEHHWNPPSYIYTSKIRKNENINFKFGSTHLERAPCGIHELFTNLRDQV